MEDRKSIRFRVGVSALAALMITCLVPFAEECGSEEPGPLYFEGGPSGIHSSDPNRAAKAIRKWSDPAEWEGEDDPAAAPYFWEFERVGRPVFIRILKNTNLSGRLEVWLESVETERFERFKTYRIAFYSGGPGPKTKEGDLQAPEGFYSISRGRMNPHSAYHLSMDLGYPNEYDRAKGRGGSLLMVHGKSASLGCFAMTDTSIEQIYTLVSAALKQGQRSVAVHCFPFPMTEEALEEHSESGHFDFWRNLKEGWDWFESHQRPPKVSVKGGNYTFGAER